MNDKLNFYERERIRLYGIPIEIDIKYTGKRPEGKEILKEVHDILASEMHYVLDGKKMDLVVYTYTFNSALGSLNYLGGYKTTDIMFHRISGDRVFEYSLDGKKKGKIYWPLSYTLPEAVKMNAVTIYVGKKLFSGRLLEAFTIHGSVADNRRYLFGHDITTYLYIGRVVSTSKKDNNTLVYEFKINIKSNMLPEATYNPELIIKETN